MEPDPGQVIRQQAQTLRRQKETIRRQEQILARQQARIAELERQVQELSAQVARLKKNSSNSSKPPSSDITKPPPDPPRRGRKNTIGGQPGRADAGHRLPRGAVGRHLDLERLGHPVAEPPLAVAREDDLGDHGRPGQLDLSPLAGGKATTFGLSGSTAAPAAPAASAAIASNPRRPNAFISWTPRSPQRQRVRPSGTCLGRPSLNRSAGR